jgi:hypothetical protein
MSSGPGHVMCTSCTTATAHTRSLVTYRHSEREVQFGRRELAGTAAEVLTGEELSQAAIAKGAAAHALAPPVCCQVWELVKAAFPAQALDVARFRDGLNHGKAHCGFGCGCLLVRDGGSSG